MNKETTGRLILEASTGMHGDVAKRLAQAWTELAHENERLRTEPDDPYGVCINVGKRMEITHFNRFSNGTSVVTIKRKIPH